MKSMKDWLTDREKLRSDHIRQEIRDLITRGNVTPDEWRALRMNSYEREAIVPALSTETLLHHVEYCLSQCSRVRSPPSMYEEAVVRLLAPEMVKRLREQAERWAKALPWLPGPNFGKLPGSDPGEWIRADERNRLAAKLRSDFPENRHAREWASWIDQNGDSDSPDRGRRRLFANYIWRMRLWAHEKWENDPAGLVEKAYLAAANEAERVALNCWFGFDVEKDRR